MFIMDNDLTIMRCEICGINCGEFSRSQVVQVKVGNILAAEICHTCMNKVTDHIQKLLSREAVKFYREIYHLPIDPHGELEPGQG